MAVEGFRCTAFCYGQTGSGKTHTLTGPPGLVILKKNLVFCVYEIVSYTFCVYEIISYTFCVYEIVTYTLISSVYNIQM